MSTKPTPTFHEFLDGSAPPPPAAALLGWTLRALDPEAGTIEVGFSVDTRFTNPAGQIQGGFLAAMLDDTVGPALLATLGPGQWAPTVSLHVQYLSPASPGNFVGRGRIVRKGGTIAFLTGELDDADGITVAVAQATARIRTPRSD
ncbi:PaaI family thioesterase [Rhodococcus rhodnii]|uniref:Thioesterase domain-containing protein n=2 Tax=Rhodococcus rhodnii TaxID=38312 RepID=R7WTD9_9NOCA|nr:PaaI family thioesterase [Rhodococcus rhodnii]EOM78540.1 hypothetical protein Rrhod_0078 [Rhodococcus rhodnii LMG 5362]TXG91328.1 PaaI family thioesterase [Rhodococcus rhodnii]